MLAPGEVRDETLRFLATPREVRGVVLQMDGSPAPGAGVTVHPGDGSAHVTETTSSSGEFVVTGLYVDHVRLSIRHGGHAGWFDPSYATRPAASMPDVIALQVGRSVTVSARAAAGRLDADSVRFFCRAPDGRPIGPDARLGGGRVRFDHLPDGRVTFVTQFAGRSFEHDHDTVEREAHVVLPPVGTIRLRWLPATREDCHRIRIEAWDGVEVRHTLRGAREEPDMQVSAGIILPAGDYRVEATDPNGSPLPGAEPAAVEGPTRTGASTSVPSTRRWRSCGRRRRKRAPSRRTRTVRAHASVALRVDQIRDAGAALVLVDQRRFDLRHLGA